MAANGPQSLARNIEFGGVRVENKASQNARQQEFAATDDHDRSGALVGLIGAALSGFVMGLIVGLII